MNPNQLPGKVETAIRLYNMGEIIDVQYQLAVEEKAKKIANKMTTGKPNNNQIDSIIDKIEQKLGNSTEVPFLFRPFVNKSAIDECLLHVKELRYKVSSEQEKHNFNLIVGCLLAGILSAVVTWNLRGANLEIPKKVSIQNPQNVSQLVVNPN